MLGNLLAPYITALVNSHITYQSPRFLLCRVADTCQPGVVPASKLRTEAYSTLQLSCVTCYPCKHRTNARSIVKYQRNADFEGQTLCRMDIIHLLW